jgi:hypothetical protein
VTEFHTNVWVTPVGEVDRPDSPSPPWPWLAVFHVAPPSVENLTVMLVGFDLGSVRTYRMGICPESAVVEDAGGGGGDASGVDGEDDVVPEAGGVDVEDDGAELGAVEELEAAAVALPVVDAAVVGAGGLAARGATDDATAPPPPPDEQLQASDSRKSDATSVVLSANGFGLKLPPRSKYRVFIGT